MSKEIATYITRRRCAPGAERRIGQVITVLDHGEVELLDYMGTDDQIVQSARVTSGPSTRPIHDDRGLLRYMLRHQHTSPFEMCEARFRMRMPIFVARQWVRHRTANINEMSLRMSEPLDLSYAPALEDVAIQSTDNKQGRGATLDPQAAERVRSVIAHHGQVSHECYRVLSELGVAKEIARCVLPVAEYTEWIWKCDLHNLLHLLKLRLDPHAQLEIRRFAEAVAAIVEDWVPETWAAFTDYTRYGMHLGMHEQAAILTLDTHPEFTLEEAVRSSGLRGREAEEALAKLRRLMPDHDRRVMARRDLDVAAVRRAREGDKIEPIKDLLERLVLELQAQVPTTAIGPETKLALVQELNAIAGHPMVRGVTSRPSDLRDMFAALEASYTGDDLQSRARRLALATLLDCPTLKEHWNTSPGERLTPEALLVLRTALHVTLDPATQGRCSRELDAAQRWRSPTPPPVRDPAATGDKEGK